jgi:hypothetical protein
MDLCCLLLIVGGSATSAAAEPSHERLTLSLSGPDCSVQRRSIAEALSQHSGVTRVDLETVPDHALLDVVRGSVTAEILTTAVKSRLNPESACRVELMESCVTAGPPMAKH